MGGYKKKGPAKKPKKSRKKVASLAKNFEIPRGHKARMRRHVLPI